MKVYSLYVGTDSYEVSPSLQLYATVVEKDEKAYYKKLKDVHSIYSENLRVGRWPWIIIDEIEVNTETKEVTPIYHALIMGTLKTRTVLNQRAKDIPTKVPPNKWEIFLGQPQFPEQILVNEAVAVQEEEENDDD